MIRKHAHTHAHTHVQCVVNFVCLAGNIGPPIPPRSRESLLTKEHEPLDSVDDDDETIYVTPNITSGWAKKKPCK